MRKWLCKNMFFSRFFPEKVAIYLSIGGASLINHFPLENFTLKNHSHFPRDGETTGDLLFLDLILVLQHRECAKN